MLGSTLFRSGRRRKLHRVSARRIFIVDTEGVPGITHCPSKDRFLLAVRDHDQHVADSIRCPAGAGRQLEEGRSPA
jgi:hypothetical protein